MTPVTNSILQTPAIQWDMAQHSKVATDQMMCTRRAGLAEDRRPARHAASLSSPHVLQSPSESGGVTEVEFQAARRRRP